MSSKQDILGTSCDHSIVAVINAGYLHQRRNFSHLSVALCLSMLSGIRPVIILGWRLHSMLLLKFAHRRRTWVYKRSLGCAIYLTPLA